jgi:hypothetical protein
MTTLLIVESAVVAVFLGYAVLAPLLLNLPRFSGRFEVNCPSRLQAAEMRVNPLSAALTAGYGKPHLHVRDCSLLRADQTCAEACLKGLAA